MCQFLGPREQENRTGTEKLRSFCLSRYESNANVPNEFPACLKVREYEPPKCTLDRYVFFYPLPAALPTNRANNAINLTLK